MSFLVVTRGLGFVTSCKTIAEVRKEIKRLNKIGYKKPLIYKSA